MTRTIDRLHPARCCRSRQAASGQSIDAEAAKNLSVLPMRIGNQRATPRPGVASRSAVADTCRTPFHGEAMDDDDKARRNLVIASGVVLLCWVIGLPLESLAERLLGVSPSSTTTKLVPWRVWTVALLVLGYLSLRFRFAKETAETVDELKKEWGQLVEGILRNYLRRCLARYSRTGTEPRAFRDSLDAVITEKIESMKDALRELPGSPTQRPPLARPIVLLTKVTSSNDSAYEGDVEILCAWQTPAGRQQSEGGTRPAFAITGWRRTKLRAFALLNLLVYSRSSLQILLPVVLASTAMAVVIAELTIALARH